jgi:PAS domain S-box-containing protein
LIRRAGSPTFRRKGNDGMTHHVSRKPRDTRHGAPRAGQALGVAAAYALGAWVGRALSIPGSGFSLMWPPNAVLVTALLVSRVQRWPLLLLAGAPAHLLTHPGTPLPQQAVQYAHNCVLALLAAGGVRRLNGPLPRVDRLGRMAAFLAVAVVGAPAATAALAAWMHARTTGEPPQLVWWRDFLSNALACAMLVPTALALRGGVRGWRASPRRLAEAAALGIGLVWTGRAVAVQLFDSPMVRAERTIAPLPFLVWAAVRFGSGGAGGALLLLTLALLGAAHRAGTAGADELLAMQTFLLAVAVPILLLASLIEERNEAAARFRLAEDRVSAALEASRTGTWDWDPRTGRVVCSRTNHRIFGLAEGERAGVRRFWARVHPDDRARLREEIAGAVHAGGFDAEFRVLHPDGRVRWVRTSGRAVFEARHAPEHLIGVNVDITEWKEAELALRGSEARNRAILRAMPDLMFLQDRDGRYLDHYARDPTQLLVPPEQFLGRRMEEVLPPELAATLRPCIEDALRTGGPAVTEYTLVIGGEPRHFETRLVRCGSDSVLSVVRDVTESRRSQAALAEREEQLRALTARLITAQEEERSRVAREIHDDAGQQLAALAFEVSALKRRMESAHPAEDGTLAALQSSIETLAGSIRGISHRLHPSVLEFAGLAAALRSHCAEAVAGTGVAVHLDVGPRAGRVPRDTALAAYRIVQESLRNVARHAHAANAWVAVSRAGSELRVWVRDDGRGMEAGPPVSQGLGLVSMRERARLVGGTLRVSSPPRGGTCVEAHLPLRGLPRAADSRET